MIRLRPPLGSTESHFVLLVCAMNILQKHVHVCVCFNISVDIAMERRDTRFGVTTNHWEIKSVIGHLCLTDFIILIKICLKTKS